MLSLGAYDLVHNIGSLIFILLIMFILSYSCVDPLESVNLLFVD